jgi:lysophospholipase L1-like esterase
MAIIIPNTSVISPSHSLKGQQPMQLEAVMRTDDHHIEKHNRILKMQKECDIQLVFLGDSLTRRWEDNLDLWNKYFSAYNPANFGVGGDCLENIKWRILNGELDGIAPKVIIVLAGTNNLDKDSAETIANGIQEIVAIIQDKLSDTKIVVLGLLPRNINETGINYAQKITRINSQLASLYAGSEIIYEDIGTDLINEQGVVNDTIMPDGLHLNANGYEIIGPKLRAIIDNLW